MGWWARRSKTTGTMLGAAGGAGIGTPAGAAAGFVAGALAIPAGIVLAPAVGLALLGGNNSNAAAILFGIGAVFGAIGLTGLAIVAGPALGAAMLTLGVLGAKGGAIGGFIGGAIKGGMKANEVAGTEQVQPSISWFQRLKNAVFRNKTIAKSDPQQGMNPDLAPSQAHEDKLSLLSKSKVESQHSLLSDDAQQNLTHSGRASESKASTLNVMSSLGQSENPLQQVDAANLSSPQANQTNVSLMSPSSLNLSTPPSTPVARVLDSQAATKDNNNSSIPIVVKNVKLTVNSDVFAPADKTPSQDPSKRSLGFLEETKLQEIKKELKEYEFKERKDQAASNVLNVSDKTKTTDFDIHPQKISTKKNNLTNFENILKSYQTAFPNSTPKITITSDKARANWEAAMQKIYPKLDHSIIKAAIVEKPKVASPGVSIKPSNHTPH